MENENPTALDYSPRSAQRSQKRIVIRAAIFWLFVITVAWGFYQRNDLLYRGRRLYWNYRCMHHVTPPGTVLVENDPMRAATLLATNPDYILNGSQSTDGMGKHLQEVRGEAKNQAVYWPADWRGHLSTGSTSHLAPVWHEAVSFMGERISPAGHHRLVIVPVAALNFFNLTNDLRNYSLVLDPPTVLGGPPPSHSKAFAFSGRYMPADLSPGIPDAADLSHFSVDWVVNKEGGRPRRGTIDVYLKDDDTLRCQMRDPATTRGFGF